MMANLLSDAEHMLRHAAYAHGKNHSSGCSLPALFDVANWDSQDDLDAWLLLRNAWIEVKDLLTKELTCPQKT